MYRGVRIDYVLGRDDCKSCASLRDFNIKYGHKSVRYSSLAQSVERMTVNHDVAGSSPAGGAKQNPLSKEGGFLFVLFTIHYSSFIIHLSHADF